VTALGTKTKNWQRVGYRRIVQLLVYLVIVPTALLLALGFVTMFIGEARWNILVGILIVSFVSFVVTGVVLVLVFVRRQADLSELQADFVSKVSHELRTPLTAIRLFAETLAREDANEQMRKRCLDALLAETQRLTDHIERLLDWGRMQAGRKLYELREIDVGDVVRDALAAFAASAERDQVQLTSEVATGLLPMVADRHAVVEALGNLLSNARKYGGTPPLIGLRAFADARGVVFEVTDNGAGIPRHEHRRIFERFYRIDDRLSRAREGSGLGLAIVKHTMRAHGGQVQVDSAPGRGSTFRLLFPRGVRPSPKSGASLPPASPAPPPSSSGESLSRSSLAQTSEVS
jgi:two-component system phosphate regulon sensor histidine kinase PhoR